VNPNIFLSGIFLVKTSIYMKFNSESNDSCGFFCRGHYMVRRVPNIRPKIVYLRIINMCRYDYVSTSHVDGSRGKASNISSKKDVQGYK
jgi:hypothetical protein